MGTSDRREYLTAMTLDQALLDRMQDALDFGLEVVADIQTPDGFMRVSDRNKYVGSTFYEALAEFPTVKRTLGEWLNPGLEFSTVEIGISNVDGRFNKYLAGGASFAGWLGKTVVVRLGLRDVASTYFPIFSGVVTDGGGFQRDKTKLTLVARDQFDGVNKQYPSTAVTLAVFPDIEDGLVNTVVPVVYGDYTVEVNASGAGIPAIPVNGADANVLAGTTDLQLLISENDNRDFKTDLVYVQRSDKFFLFLSAAVTGVTANRSFSIVQGGLVTAVVIDEVTGAPGTEDVTYQYQQGDKFWVQVKGKDLGAGLSDNAVAIAKDILLTYGGVSVGALDANWTTYQNKAAPAQSAIASHKARSWRQDPESVLVEVLQLLEQVRLEAFVDANLKFKIRSLHFEDFPAVAAIPYTVRNWDVEQGTFNPKLDDRNVWNRAKADYNFDPVINANAKQTATFKNAAAIAQAAGKAISKKPVFPNLYEDATVVLHLKEMLKLASAYTEFVDVVLTPRSVKKDLGEFVTINVQIGSTIFTDVPAMIREIGYDPKGLRVPVKLWSFQMIPYDSYSPTYAGIVGGSTAIITQE